MFDRSRPPDAAPARRYRFPPYSTLELARGHRVLLAPRPGAGLALVQVLAPGGGVFAPAERPGLASLAAALLDEGTAARDSLEIARAVEQLGGSLSSGCDWDSLGVSLGLLSRHLPQGLEVLADVVCHPAFPDSEIERLRRQRLAEILRRSKDPSALAAEAFARAVYGEGVYGSPLLGTRGSIERLSRQELVEHYAASVPSRRSCVVACGDFDVEALHPLLEAAFSELGTNSEPELPALYVELPPNRCITLVDRPEASQTELRLGHASVPKTHPDRPALIVLNAILGGKFTSRLNLNLRERHGYTYGVSSSFGERLGPGPFVVATAVATDSAGGAAAQILAELARIREEPVTQAELDDTRSYLLGVFPYTLQTVQGVTSRLETIAVFDLPADHYDRLADSIEAVTREQVLLAAQTHLHPERLSVVAVGPERELRPQLQDLGELAAVRAEAEP